MRASRAWPGGRLDAQLGTLIHFQTLMSRVLLLEDDGSLGRTLAERLEKEKLTVEWAQTIAAARTHLASGTWDLAILDVKLPDGSGFALAREIRRTSTTPIMFMTALNSAESRLEGF